MAKRRRLKIVVGVLVSFFSFLVGISYLGRNSIVPPTMALLMVVALIGLYVGFGILFVTYRLVNKLD